MEGVIWKAFQLSELFEFNNKNATKKAQKDMLILQQKSDLHKTALVTAGGRNNGVVGYINSNDLDKAIPSKNSYTITFNSLTIDEAGMCLFHNYEYATQTARTFNFKSYKLRGIDLVAHKFIANLLNKVFLKSHFYGYAYKIDKVYKFPREIILLPLLEVSNNDEYIWEDNGKFWTLAVDYIKELMQKAKHRKEEKTIRLYEAEKAKYEAEKAKYEAEYLKEKPNVIWKTFKLGDLFQESTEHYLEKSKKNYDISENMTKEFPIAVCAASKNNNGIVGYIQEIDDVPHKKRKGFLTKGGFGHVFYQSDWFVKPGGSWGMLNILKIKEERLKNILDLDISGYYFFAKTLTKVFTGMASWGYSVPLDREIIILPVLEVSDNDEYIWKENGKFWTLAANTVSYLYLQGQVNIQQRKINTYTYSY